MAGAALAPATFLLSTIGYPTGNPEDRTPAAAVMLDQPLAQQLAQLAERIVPTSRKAAPLGQIAQAGRLGVLTEPEKVYEEITGEMQDRLSGLQEERTLPVIG